MIASAARTAGSRVLAGVWALALLAGLVTAPVALADQHEPEVVRFAGSDRFETAAQLATSTFPNGAADVIVAAGFNFPDALAAGGLAGLFDAPILLVNDVLNALPPATRAALSVLDPDRVHIAGGPVAVSLALEETIAEAGDWQVERFAGTNRFDTAALMAERFGTLADTAVVATGRVAADSLSAGPFAYRAGWPILLTEVATLPSRTADALEGLDVDTVLVLGGTAAVGNGVVDAIERITGDGSVERLEGADRFETAAAIGRYAQDNVAAFAEIDEVALATGFGPPRPGTSERVPADALSGAPYGGTNAVPLVPINDVNDELPDASAAAIADHAETLERITVYGGTAAVSEAVVDAAVTAGSFVPVDAGVTDAPELGAAELVAVDAAADEVVVRYAFDAVVSQEVAGDAFGISALDATHVSAATADVSVAAERVGPNVVEATFIGALGNAEHELLGGEVAEGEDGLTLRAELLTAAWVDAGAVEGSAGPNPEGSAALGEGIDFAAGETAGPDLVGFTRLSDAGVFTFSEALLAVEVVDEGLVAITAGGEEVPGTGCTITSEAEVVTCAGFDGAGDIVRAYATAGAVTGASGLANPPQAVTVAGSGTTDDNPDLVDTAVDVDAGTVTYTFDRAVLPASLTPTFGVYDAAGGVFTTEASAWPSETTTVPVAFDPDVLAVASGAFVPSGTVQGGLLGEPNLFGEDGAAVTFDAGQTIGPALTAVTVDSDAMEVIIALDRDLDGETTDGVALYDGAGGRTAAAADCDVGTNEVICTIGVEEGDAFTGSQVASAELLGLEGGAVAWADTSSAAAAHPQSMPLS